MNQKIYSREEKIAYYKELLKKQMNALDETKDVWKGYYILYAIWKTAGRLRSLLSEDVKRF